jgi:hypothetical protein
MIEHNAKHAYHAINKQRKLPKPAGNPHDFSTIPAESLQALRKAMVIEHVPEEQFSDLSWIMVHESGGRVGAANAHSTARGLFQLLKFHYGLNPNGERSFGNAVEECQGGIRYIVYRYKTAANARKFWEKHHWY